VASINIIGIIGEYNNKEGTTNSDNRVPYIRPKVVFGEGIYTRRGLFIPG
jgi:hypothetical protein